MVSLYDTKSYVNARRYMLLQIRQGNNSCTLQFGQPRRMPSLISGILSHLRTIGVHECSHWLHSDSTIVLKLTIWHTCFLCRESTVPTRGLNTVLQGYMGCCCFDTFYCSIHGVSPLFIIYVFCVTRILETRGEAIGQFDFTIGFQGYILYAHVCARMTMY